MGEIIFFILGLLLGAGGVICVYDARDIATKLFGFGDKNEAAAGLKILGFIMAMIGVLIIYFNI